MTTEEHGLMVGVLAQQLQMTKALIELLNSRGLIDPGDVNAYLALTQTGVAPSVFVQAASSIYLSIAERLGVKTGLEPPPAGS